MSGHPKSTALGAESDTSGLEVTTGLGGTDTRTRVLGELRTVDTRRMERLRTIKRRRLEWFHGFGDIQVDPVRTTKSHDRGAEDEGPSSRSPSLPHAALKEMWHPTKQEPHKPTLAL